jgi:hypothetical protein
MACERKITARRVAKDKMAAQNSTRVFAKVKKQKYSL